MKSKVMPPGGSIRGPFIVANLLKRLFQVEADLTSNSCEWKLELFEATGCHLAVAMLCVTLMYAARFEQHDSREYLSGASNRPPGRHRIQNVEGPVLDPCAKQMYFKRGPKVDPLRIESGPS